ncbi:MAG: hypothetical protein QOJ15_1024, partial [Bradyrhizobium sp.]|nr:hypothetical protein [Bradyrhizobium sp.]
MRVTQFLMMALLVTLPFGAQAAEP